jgi:protein tyrosine/serine phosphatase
MTDLRFRILDNVHNLRDFGGYAAAGGAIVRRGLLWRAGHQAQASDADLDTVDALALAHVVDLRGTKERAKWPSRRSDRFDAEVIAFEGETAGLAPHMEAVKGALDVNSARQAMIDLYAALPEREGLNAVIPRYFAALAEGKGASLVHCAAGKDRTGIACDLVLHALGVHADDRMEDYLLTNCAPDNEARIAHGLSMVGEKYGMRDEAAGRVIMGVEPAFLEAARASLIEAEGSIDAYLERRWGVDEAMKAKMRGHLCE